MARAEGPLPAVGDMWGREVLDAPLVAGPVIARPHTAGPVSYPRTRTTPAATASMVCGLAAVPLTVALGLGGLLGVVAVVLGLVSIRTIRREPGCRGTGQALTGVVLGTGSAVIGLPILAGG
ncbi:DUF4190 domain-containing protein [Gordonia sp. DT30]|uniref:DUF4190 domain-containing protein n=1 Tax=Gordonia sp. DT30 TaxID=3416546 RepID=UPI003CF5308E